MNNESIFVAAVAAGLSGFSWLAALHNHPWYYRLNKIQWVEKRWGHGAARATYAVLGAIAAGMAAVICWRG